MNVNKAQESIQAGCVLPAFVVFFGGVSWVYPTPIDALPLLDTLLPLIPYPPRYLPSEGTWDQRFPIPPEGTWDREGTWHQRYTTSPYEQTDRRL